MNPKHRLTGKHISMQVPGTVHTPIKNDVGMRQVNLENQ